MGPYRMRGVRGRDSRGGDGETPRGRQEGTDRCPNTELGAEIRERR